MKINSVSFTDCFKETIKLYHIDFYDSLDEKTDLTKFNLQPKEFIPCIPRNRLITEDSTIPRICMSTSISGAISSCPFDVQDITTDYYAIYYIELTREEFLTMIEEDVILAPSSVSAYVSDALIFQEFWITREMVLDKTYIKFTYLDYQPVIATVEESNEAFKDFLISKNLYSFTGVHYDLAQEFRIAQFFNRTLDYYNQFANFYYNTKEIEDYEEIEDEELFLEVIYNLHKK